MSMLAVHGNTVNRFSLTDMSLVRKIGGNGSNDGQFKWPKQLTTDSTGRVFIADFYNDRICIHDPDLNHREFSLCTAMTNREDPNRRHSSPVTFVHG